MIDEVATETGLLSTLPSLFLYFLNIHRGRLSSSLDYQSCMCVCDDNWAFESQSCFVQCLSELDSNWPPMPVYYERRSLN